MSENKDLFYLDKVFPEPDKIFSAQYKSLQDLFKTAIFVFDTNALLVPFDTSEKNLNEIKTIFLNLKENKRIFIPARVAREFAKNRANKLGDLFLNLRQLKNGLNTGTFKINDYPLLDGLEEYHYLKKNFVNIISEIKAARINIENLEKKILSWSWNDAVSLAYAEIFTTDIIENLSISNKDLEEDLKFRFNHKIAPGYKDSNKIDDGIGDLVIWHTILEIGKKYSSDVIFISNDEKNDWYHKQDKIGMYPRFELHDEFRRATNDKSFSIINFLRFLELSNAKSETLQEVKQSIEETKKLIEENYQRGLKNLVIGLEIKHSKFGIGIITKITETKNSGQIVEVQFANHGRKLIMVNYALLKILETSNNFKLLKLHFDGEDNSYQLMDIEPET